MRRLLRTLSFLLEAAGLLSAYGLLRVLPMPAAAGFGERVLRMIGPLLPLHETARRNLALAYPEAGPDWIAATLDGMWRNLGRTAGEYPHLHRIRADLDAHVELVGDEHLQRLRASGGPAIFLSAHLANWEILGLVAAERGFPLTLVYRAPNNPFLRRLFERPASHPDSRMIPKGPEGARALLGALRTGHCVAMLVDQKMNDGVEARFFGLPAMTAGAFATLARRHRCPLVTVRVERLEGSRFRVTVEPPLLPAGTPDDPALVQQVNDRVETWVRARPEQWLWVHRRWPKTLTKS